MTETFTGVKKIQTINENGSVTWVPLDETELAIKTVNQNGTYKASSDGYYGYRQVTVSTKNKGKTVGTKSDGRTYSVDTDDDGWLTEKLLPDNIRINPQPTKTTYHNGETISLSGAVVKAYSKNDIWEGDGYSGGVIPHSELVLEPDTASGGSGSDGESATSDLVDGTVYINFYSEFDRGRYFDASIYGLQTAIRGSGSTYNCVVASSSSEATWLFNGDATQPLTEEYTANGKTVYYSPVRIGDVTKINVGAVSDAVGSDERVAWTMIYGDISGGGGEQISVKWNRPEDEEELTTAFDITVS